MERKKYRPNADTEGEKQPTSDQRKKRKKKENPVSIDVCRTLNNQMNLMRCS